MNKIKVLSEIVANKIAAGEVIERPYSIVKELIENAIDAKATKIDIKITFGGKRQIIVSDNGIGMSKDDLILAFERHATSKIFTQDDIFNISSLGFRGEALPSIASISRLSMTSRENSNVLGSRIIFDFGILKKVEDCSANVGTTVKVSSIFFRVPARKKFLKSSQVEYSHILNYLHYQTILYPKIHFRLFHNERSVFNYPLVENREKRIISVFGKSFEKAKFIKIKSEQEEIKISGYIGNFENSNEFFSKKKYIFINGRYVKDKLIFHAIRKGYEPAIKKFGNILPPFMIFIELNSLLIDFNVHPAKQEVRFQDTWLVYNAVKNVVNSAYLKYESGKFQLIKETIKDSLDIHRLSKQDRLIYNSFTNNSNTVANRASRQLDIFHTSDEFSEIQQKTKELDSIPLSSEVDFINPWQLHQSYIFIQDEAGLLAIDQHAAHERVLYEKIIHRLHGATTVSQKLIFPIIVDLPPYLADHIKKIVEEKNKLFLKAGISIENFSGNTVAISEVPVELRDWNDGKMFWPFFEDLQERLKQKKDFKECLAASMSCKAAIKAGEKLTKAQMLTLINDLFACHVPYFCPHGRPTIVKLTIPTLEKMFKRT